MIAIERGQRLVMFEGIPSQWLVPGKEIRVQKIATEFGQLSLRAGVASDGQSATIDMAPIGKVGEPGSAVIDLRVFKQAGFTSTSGENLPSEISVPWGEPLTLSLRK
jgi:hypothetical protein